MIIALIIVVMMLVVCFSLSFLIANEEIGIPISLASFVAMCFVFGVIVNMLHGGF